MAPAALFYYPTGSATLKMIDLGGPLSALTDWGVQVSSSSRSFTGNVSRQIFEQSRRVQATKELITSPTVVAELQTLEHHLKSGGSVALAEDQDYCFCGFLSWPPYQFDAVVDVQANQFQNFGPGGTTVGDTVVLQGNSPTALREVAFVASRSGLEVTLTGGVTLDWRGDPEPAWILLRDHRFWPVLHLAEGQENSQLIRPTDGRRITWEMELALEERSGAIDLLAGVGYDVLWPGTDEVPGGGGLTIEGALGSFVPAAALAGEAPVGY